MNYFNSSVIHDRLIFERDILCFCRGDPCNPAQSTCRHHAQWKASC